MEHDMRSALRADQYPVIEFVFDGLRGAIVHDIDRRSYTIPIAGDLTIAGTKREVELSITISRQTNDSFRVTATLPLRMSSFGIKPPTALFGLIQADDTLGVRFNITMEADS
jgi:polyisoprenoid-binding protein YceI